MKLPLAKAIGLAETGESITVAFKCPCCGRRFEVSGKRGDPPPPPVKDCPHCGKAVQITP